MLGFTYPHFPSGNLPNSQVMIVGDGFRYSTQSAKAEVDQGTLVRAWAWELQTSVPAAATFTIISRLISVFTDGRLPELLLLSLSLSGAVKAF